LTDKLIEQVILQAPTVAALLYLLFRLDARMALLIQTICELADADREEKAKRRLEDLLPPKHE